MTVQGPSTSTGHDQDGMATGITHPSRHAGIMDVIREGLDDMISTMNRKDSSIALAEAKLFVGILGSSGALKRIAPGFGDMQARMFVSSDDTIADFIGAISEIAGSDIVTVSMGGDDESILHLEFLKAVRCDGDPVKATAAVPANGGSSVSRLLRSMGQSRTISYDGSVWMISYLGRADIDTIPDDDDAGITPGLM